MTNLAHIAETALLLSAAYLLGCVLGYAARLVLYAGRGTRQVAPSVGASVAAPSPEPRRPRSSAARLAASVEETSPPVSDAAARPAVGEPVSAANPTAMAKAAPAQPPAAAAQPPAKPAGKTKSSGPRPATLAEPRGGRADNLKQIKGIGPKIEASLHAMGIFHIDQIAGWNRANVDWVDAQLSFKGRIRRERWVEQALQLGITGTDA